VRIFVSYSRAQFYFAEDLALALDQRGAKTWFDVHRLQPGDDWDAAILAALRACDGVVLIASAEALASPQVRSEIDRAKEFGKPVIVAAAEEVDLPDSLACAPLFDLRRGFDAKLEQLMASLRDEDAVAPAREASSPWSGQAWVVRFVSGALLGAALCWETIAVLLALFPPSEDYPAALVAAMSGCYSVICAWLWWATSHRRHGWVRVLGVAFVLSLPFALLLSLASLGGLILFAVRGDWSVLPGVLIFLEVVP
jgi:hypothetical protein